MGRKTIPDESIMAVYIWAELLTDARTGKPNQTAIALKTGISTSTVAALLAKDPPEGIREYVDSLRSRTWSAVRHAIVPDIARALVGLAERLREAAETPGADARDTKFLADSLSVHLRTTALLSGDVTSRTHREEVHSGSVEHAHRFEIISVPAKVELPAVYGLIGDGVTPDSIPEALEALATIPAPVPGPGPGPGPAPATAKPAKRKRGLHSSPSLPGVDPDNIPRGLPKGVTKALDIRRSDRAARVKRSLSFAPPALVARVAGEDDE